MVVIYQMQAILQTDTGCKPLYQTKRLQVKDTATILATANNSEAAFEQLFKTHFKALHCYALCILKDELAAEEIVQNVFLKYGNLKASLLFSRLCRHICTGRFTTIA